MSLHVATAREQSARHILLTGDVQGYGIRPDVAKLAKSLALAGTVRNSNHGVEIGIQGAAPDIERFCSALAAIVPEAILDIEPAPTKTLSGFQIISSDTDAIPSLELPLDRVICDDCLAEVFTPGNRRFGYALNSCAKCGPRFSIMRGTPYDRERTSMADFPMCELCETEFLDPSSRRFHAQTNCCPDCGPQVWFTDNKDHIEHRKPIELATAALRDGNILALKGIGGYQLICDGTDEQVVRRLRNCKGRVSKPLAVMVNALGEARQLAVIDALEENALQSPAGPIVILKARIRKDTLADNIHPGLGSLGIMLPTTAMHAMLSRTVGRPLVVTSGNREGDPMHFDEQMAATALDSMADCFLHHNRSIETALDDSVVRCMAGQIATVRAGRGIAPMHLSIPAPPGLATGGQQKVAIAISNGQRSFLGSHIGDMNSLTTRARFEQQVEHSESVLRARPAILACDAHPDYFTSGWSSQIDQVQAESVQHHHAHIAAGMVERGWLDSEVLGFAFDGTGYGSDASIWGGEVLLATLNSFRRVAHLRRFQLPGGEQAIREPWRIAASLIREAYKESWLEVSSLLNLTEPKLSQVARLLETNLSPITSSMGRLFDGVAAIALGAHAVNFEGEAAMRLEAACGAAKPGSYPCELTTTGSWPMEIDWRPAIHSLVADLVAGETGGTVAMRFHRGIADCVADLADRFSEHPIILSGGVFQNRVLVELVADRTMHRNMPVALPGRIPVNDGGLAAGQLAVATRRFQENKSCV